jgi:hypothetical protein
MTQSCSDQRDVYRQEYWQGQALRSRDLIAQTMFEEQLRWWHNRAVHHAYGILKGFEVEKDGKVVLVSAGLAYDAFGRPLRLSRDTEVSLPKPCEKRSEKWMLVVRAMTIQLGGRNDQNALETVCVGETRRKKLNSSHIHLEWKPERQFNYRDGVAIALVQIDGTGKLLDLSQECLSRICPRGVPYLVNGETILGHTSWQIWNEGGRAGSFGVQVRIDTSAAGFVRSPIYVASITPLHAPTLPTYVTEVSDSGFTFRVTISNLLSIRTLDEIYRDMLLSWLRKLVAVQWVGFEPPL